MKKKRPQPKSDPDWAKKAVAKMSPEEVRENLRRLGYGHLAEPDRRTPLERMIDEACGVPDGPHLRGTE